ncbi:hypothetical protein BB560_007169 [Smittium megazygosporum]|uniref:Tyrosinase copper-binding domain-containing protein n=1 Tax=Smittium megazygosporum TaxID=133381 RepID=A0A2T9XY90_9FUNG|nr:hypothetical protein BB560_007169 [Smittium megazygosporum]
MYKYSWYSGLFLPLLLVSQLSTVYGQTGAKCTVPISVRKEIRTLSPVELQSTKDTISKMHDAGWFDWFAYVHTYYSDPIHGYPQFFPWHRYFLREYELAGQQYDPSFAAHYWDSSIDGANPNLSDIFTDSYWGGNGSGSDMCISSGFEKGWIKNIIITSCLTRNFSPSGKIGAWITSDVLSSSLTKAKKYSDLQNSVENKIHASVHNNVGGDMATMASPSDSLFFLHHSFMDYLWSKWQQSSSGNLMSFDGTDIDGNIVSVSNQLSAYNIPVSDVMVLGYGKMCYSYDTQLTLAKRDIKSKNSTSVPNFGRTPSNRDSDIQTLRSMISDPQEIQKITQVPTMSLVALLNNTILDEFFPGITSGEVSSETIHMPDVVTTKAVDYATQYLENSSDQVNTTVVPVASTSITDSLLATVNDNCLNCTDTGTGSDASSQRRLRSGKFNRELRTADAPETPDSLKLPIPARLPDSYLKMMNINIDEYNNSYNEDVKLINILNQVGYISPYIQ